VSSARPPHLEQYFDMRRMPARANDPGHHLLLLVVGATPSGCSRSTSITTTKSVPTADFGSILRTASSTERARTERSSVARGWVACSASTHVRRCRRLHEYLHRTGSGHRTATRPESSNSPVPPTKSLALFSRNLIGRARRLERRLPELRIGLELLPTVC
jgi:hypothetical protein